MRFAVSLPKLPWGLTVNNPYLPIWKPISLCQAAVLMPETLRQTRRARHWAMGYADAAKGKPCSSANGAYLEGWYAATDAVRRHEIFSATSAN